MINYYFCQSLKKSEISVIINLFTSVLQMKLFLQNNIAFTKKCAVKESISCTIFSLLLCGCVQKQSFRGAPEITCYYMIRKAFKNSSREVHFLVSCFRVLFLTNLKKTLQRGFFYKKHSIDSNSFKFYRPQLNLTENDSIWWLYTISNDQIL